MAAVTASARRRGLPQHRGQTPEPAKRGRAQAKLDGDSGQYLLQGRPASGGFRGAKKPTWSTQAATGGRLRSGPPITCQASQILGFVAGAAVVAILDPRKTLGMDAATFGMSALIVLFGVRARPTLGREGTARPSLWSVSAAGLRVVFGSGMLLTLLLFGCWQASASSPRAWPRRTRVRCTAAR